MAAAVAVFTIDQLAKCSLLWLHFPSLVRVFRSSFIGCRIYPNISGGLSPASKLTPSNRYQPEIALSLQVTRQSLWFQALTVFFYSSTMSWFVALFSGGNKNVRRGQAMNNTHEAFSLPTSSPIGSTSHIDAFNPDTLNTPDPERSFSYPPRSPMDPYGYGGPTS